ncbi:MAG: hypothetical protein HY921_09200 [Elusimicrobia bacterium]|nr:hypothetical protein [Elusimicrobiota bacterium]
MSYQVKRIDPFWHTHPMIPTAVAIGLMCGVAGYLRQLLPVTIGGVAIAALAIFFAARPALSALFATMGFLGGAVKFLLIPAIDVVSMSLKLKILSMLIFVLFYMVLMNALVLVVAVLYNLYAGALGWGGVRLELEAATEAESA